MSELTFLPGEELIDQRGGDFGSGMTKTSGNCVITNQRLIVCSLSKPKSELKGAIAGVGAKWAFGDAAAMALNAVTFAQALKSKKPLYPVLEQPLENLTQITTWRFGFAAGVNISTTDVEKFSVKLGTGKTRDRWIVTLREVVTQHCPHVTIHETGDAITFTRTEATQPATSPALPAAQPTPNQSASPQPGQAQPDQTQPPSLQTPAPKTRATQKPSTQPPATQPPATPASSTQPPTLNSGSPQPPPIAGEAPQPKVNHFVIQRGDKKSKPMTNKQLLTYIRNGKLKPDDQVLENTDGGKIITGQTLINKYGKHE